MAEGNQVVMNEAQLLRLLGARGGGGGGHLKIDKLKTIDADSWLEFKANFNSASAANGWEDDKKKLALQNAMTGAAFRLCQTIGAGADGLTYDQYLALYEAKFLPPTDSDTARAEFQRARQNSEENPRQWGGRLMTLYSRAYPNGDLNDEVNKSQFVKGLVDSSARQWTFQTMTPNNTFDQLVETASSWISKSLALKEHSANLDQLSKVEPKNKGLFAARVEDERDDFDYERCEDLEIAAMRRQFQRFAARGANSSEGKRKFGHRNSDGKVICRYCNEPGHIQKFCKWYIKCMKEFKFLKEKEKKLEPAGQRKQPNRSMNKMSKDDENESREDDSDDESTCPELTDDEDQGN